VKHVFPLCFLAAQENGADLQHACKHGILQYVVVRPASTLVAFCCEQAGVYGEGELSFSVAFPYLLLVNNVSQFAAMYCLVLFYRANRVRLRPMRPLPKFLCIKAVVFFSFFQQVIVALLVRLGALDAILPPADKQVSHAPFRAHAL
jgi:Organic solute transporter Ostalpha